jgi:hypothetical protein
MWGLPLERPRERLAPVEFARAFGPIGLGVGGGAIVDGAVADEGAAPELRRRREAA